MNSFVLQVIVTQNEDGNFVARVPSLPACVSCAGTREEALAKVGEAAKQYMETLGVENFALTTQGSMSEVEVSL